MPTEMTNQAAQTMPELPDSQYRGGNDVFGKEFPLYTADQMHQYARDYAAALSQTAGVGEGMVMVQKHDLEWIVAHVLDECDGSGPCADLAARRVRALLAAAPAASGVHPDALPDGTLSKSTAKRVEALAASGVDISHVTIDFPQVGTAGPFKVIDGRMTLPDVTMNDLIHHARMGYVPASNPPAAASLSSNPNPVTPSLSSESAAAVSERARELLATECGVSPEMVYEYQDRDVIVRLALRAIEKALTQQRGEAAAWLIRDERGRVVDAVESEAQRDRLLNTGYGQLPQWTAEPLYAGSAPLASACTSWTHEDLKDLRERLVSAGISAHLNGDSNKASDRQFIRQAVTEAYGLIDDLLTTTPQPSADAVREDSNG